MPSCHQPLAIAILTLLLVSCSQPGHSQRTSATLPHQLDLLRPLHQQLGPPRLIFGKVITAIPDDQTGDRKLKMEAAADKALASITKRSFKGKAAWQRWWRSEGQRLAEWWRLRVRRGSRRATPCTGDPSV